MLPIVFLTLIVAGVAAQDDCSCLPAGGEFRQQYLEIMKDADVEFTKDTLIVLDEILANGEWASCWGLASCVLDRVGGGGKFQPWVGALKMHRVWTTLKQMSQKCNP